MIWLISLATGDHQALTLPRDLRSSRQVVPKSVPQTIIRELTRNANSWYPPQTKWIRNPGNEPGNLPVNKPSRGQWLLTKIELLILLTTFYSQGHWCRGKSDSSRVSANSEQRVKMFPGPTFCCATVSIHKFVPSPDLPSTDTYCGPTLYQTLC